MGIEEAIKKQREAEDAASRGERDVVVGQAAMERVREELYRDFAGRLRRAGVNPQVVYIERERHFLMRWLNGRVKVDTGKRAWPVTDAGMSESHSPWRAVTVDGTAILVHHGQYKGSKALYEVRVAPERSGLGVTRKELDEYQLAPAARARIIEETSAELATALQILGAV